MEWEEKGLNKKKLVRRNNTAKKLTVCIDMGKN